MEAKTKEALGRMADIAFRITMLREAMRTNKITFDELNPQLETLARELTTLTTPNHN